MSDLLPPGLVDPDTLDRASKAWGLPLLPRQNPPPPRRRRGVSRHDILQTLALMAGTSAMLWVLWLIREARL